MPPTLNHEIKVSLVTDSNGRQHAVPALPSSMNVGDTVHYSSPDGEVTIEFQDKDLSDPQSSRCSPFVDANGVEKTVVSSNDAPIPLSNAGVYFGRCFITPRGKARIGWGSDSPESGGNNVVKAKGM